MAIRDLVNNRSSDQPRSYRSGDHYERRRFSLGGRLITQTIVAVLLFVVISYAYNTNNSYQTKVKAAVDWAMTSDGITMPAMK